MDQVSSKWSISEARGRALPEILWEQSKIKGAVSSKQKRLISDTERRGHPATVNKESSTSEGGSQDQRLLNPVPWTRCYDISI